MKHRSVILALVIVQVLFSALPIAAKIVLQQLSSPAITLARVSGAALLFFAIQRLTIHEPIRQRRDFGRLAYYSLLGVSMNQLLYITGLTLTTATAAQMLITGGPAVTLLIAILLGKEQATRQKWIGIALAGAGALVLVGVASLETGALGNILIVVNMIAYSLYLVSARDMLHRYHPLTVITWLFIFGSVILVPFGLPALIREFPHTTPTARLLLLAIILLPTVTAYYLNMWALQHVESSVVSTFVYLQPMLTTAMAVPILGERPSLRMVPAAFLIFAGVAISIQAARRPDHRPDPADQAVIEP